ncbi:MAG: extracellular solute-binding protein [Treponema sp.]|nr:extracellular solute-binding protein [Treponema sp.]
MKSGKILFLSIVLSLTTVFFLSASGRIDSGTQAASTGVTGKISYPINTPVTITYWMNLANNVSANYSNLGLTPYGRAWQEKTGIKVDFIHPASGTSTEQFNLIIASGDLPDIMEWNWLTYPGGPENAISDGVILKLNDIIPKWAPNFREYFDAHPDMDKMIRTDNGSYYVFPFVRGDFGLLLSSGVLVRQDWLNELGLKMPETIDEWHTVLTAFRDKKNVLAPYTNYNFANVPFAYAYGVYPRAFTVGDNGKVRYDPIENGYRDYLSTFAQWYKEKLIDPDIASIAFAQVQTKMINGDAGVAVAALGSGMGVWSDAGRQINPQYTLTGAPIPVLNKGDKPTLASATYPYAGINSVAITTKAKNVEMAARLLDWNYSQDGYYFNNFGIEGESFNFINGYPTYTDIVMKNPNGLPLAQSIAVYARSQDGGPFIQDLRYLEQYYSLQEQKDAINLWVFQDMLKHIMPPITPTTQESQEFAQIMNDINTYQREMETRFILGIESIGNWDNYVSTIKQMGIDRAIEIQNAALSRYQVR